MVMAKIQVLDEQTINQIAAGEVIENPSSVVKELVENAIDAGAGEITVEIRGGGRQLIRITDDGCGMSREDALLALKRHATSKLRQVEDLASVATMGFRGEAIPSIASISKMMLLTSDGEATMVLVEGGEVVEAETAARERGTTIEIKNLFYNVPVRKKFQRSPTYDANEIQKVVTMQALAHPDVKFELINDQKKVIRTSKDQTLQERVKEVLGQEFYRGTYPIEAKSGPYTIRGVIGLPNFTRQNRTGQYLFINRRAVVSPVISYAVRDGYGTALPTQRHPIWVLQVEMDGDLVDVNVHPQKREVRVREQQILRELIVSSVRKALQGNAPVIEEPLEASDEYVVVRPTFSMVAEEAVELPLPKPISKPAFKQPETLFEEKKVIQAPQVLAAIPRYLIIQTEAGEGLKLVDQRAAHARVVFEKLRTGKAKIAQQTLLVPFTIQLPKPDHQVLLEQLDSLNAMGLSVREGGPDTLIIDAIPQVFGNCHMEQLIQDIAHCIREYDDTSHFQNEVEKQLAQAASRSSVGAATKLSLIEGQSLVNQLMQCETPSQCPRGQPTMALFSTKELVEKFHGSNPS